MPTEGSTADEELPAGIELLLDTAPPTGFYGIAWSPDGEQLAVGGLDGEVFVHDLATGEWSTAVERPDPDAPRGLDFDGGSSDDCTAVAWAPGPVLASGDNTGRFVLDGVPVDDALGLDSEMVTGVAWSPAGDRVAVTRNTGRIDVHTADRRPISSHLDLGRIRCLAWSPDGTELCAGTNDGDLFVFDPFVGGGDVTHLHTGHSGTVWDVDWAADGRIAAATASGVHVVHQRELQISLEGSALGIRFFAGGDLLAKHGDGGIEIWSARTWDLLWRTGPASSRGGVFGLAAHPTRPVIATRLGGVEDRLVVYSIDPAVLAGVEATTTARYVAAKVVLVGDSGVGKTSLGHRIATGGHQDHPSTHGQHFWALGSAGDRRADGAECEIILWDLAGQPDYRLIHSLFVDDADLAVLVFDPTVTPDPLGGPQYWCRALSKAREEGARTILVASRADVGANRVPPDQLDAFCTDHQVALPVVHTSAVTGEGVAGLLARIEDELPWSTMPATISSVAFREVKDLVLRAKARLSGEGDDVLISFARLREIIGQGDDLTDRALTSVVQALARHGFVHLLRTPAGENRVLMRPELLNNVAASIVIEARRNPDGLGAVDEDHLVQGAVEIRELRDLPADVAHTLLDHAVARFLSRALCVRERWSGRSLLVFPELINLRRPETDEDTALVEGSAYVVRGEVETVYAALVVLLGYTNVLARTAQWHDEAHYRLASGHVVGFRLLGERPGELEVVLCAAEDTTEAERTLFRGLFETILESRRLEVVCHPPLICSECGHQQDRRDVSAKVRRGQDKVFCEDCGQRLALDGGSPLGTAAGPGVETLAAAGRARRRATFEGVLTRLRGLVHFRTGIEDGPTCFVSYAWGDPDHETWVRETFSRDLDAGGARVTLDVRDNGRTGSSVARFVEGLADHRWVVVVGTPAYLDGHLNTGDRGRVVAAETDLIGQRMTGTEEQKRTVLPVVAEGDETTSLPPLLRGRVRHDLTDERRYFSEVFELLLTIHGVERDDPLAVELRQELDGY
jgi:small GTP-binding protein